MLAGCAGEGPSFLRGNNATPEPLTLANPNATAQNPPAAATAEAPAPRTEARAPADPAPDPNFPPPPREVTTARIDPPAAPAPETPRPTITPPATATAEAPAPAPTPATPKPEPTVTAEAPTPAPAPAPAPAAAGDGRLGTTVASIGSADEPGFWIKTPLVSANASGRLFYPESGRTVQVQLIPGSGSGSQVSLAALRLLDAPLDGQPELVVYQN